MEKIKTAIILAAGLGARLKPITNDSPKCMTEVRGKPIIRQTIELLEKNGINHAVIVVGYLGRQVVDYLGNRFDNMRISYVWNKKYEQTNNMYSLWLARNYLLKGCLIIEGDCIYEDLVIKKILHTKNTGSFWAACRFTEENSGSLLKAKGGRISEINIVKQKLRRYKSHYYKSAGLLKIVKKDGRKLVKFFDREVRANNVKIYYDLVLAKYIKEMRLYVCKIDGYRWFEVDTLEDLKRAEGTFESVKYVVIICDGASDLPLAALNGKTPFEYACLPKLHEITARGAVCLVKTSFKGLPVGSIVACLGLLGYNPYRYYPNGRASFEALAQGIYVEPGDICFRCNFVSIKNKKLSDFTAGMISTDKSVKLLANIDFGNPDVEMFSGQDYRNILIVRNALCPAAEIIAREPHMHIGQDIRGIMLKARTARAKPVVKMLNQYMTDSFNILAGLNRKLKTKADMVWLWSPSGPAKLPSFHEKHQMSCAIIAGLDFMRGIGEAASISTKPIEGATGYVDTNLKEKLKFAKNYIQHNDILFVHINMADEAAHQKNPGLKVRCLERIHNEFLEPLLEFLEKKYKNSFRLAFLSDHYTLSKNGKHYGADVPCVVYGAGVDPAGARCFTEKEIKQNAAATVKSYEFMSMLKDYEATNE